MSVEEQIVAGKNYKYNLIPEGVPRSDENGQSLGDRLRKGMKENLDDFVEDNEDDEVKEKWAKKGFMKLGYGTVAFFNF